MEYFTYVLYSKLFDRIYIGQTNNLENRLETHNFGMVKSTRHYVHWKLIYKEEHETRTQAMKMEKELKSQKGRDIIREQLVRVWQLPD